MLVSNPKFSRILSISPSYNPLPEALIAFPSRFPSPNEPPLDCLSETIDTTRSYYCGEFVRIARVDSKVPTSSEFGLCFLLGSGRGTAQWNVQRQQSTIYSDIDASPPYIQSPSQAATPESSPQDTSPIPPEHLFLEPQITENNSLPRRANATLMILARNSDIDGVIQSIEQVESKFNRKFNYPWVLLNDVEFSAEFKK